MRGWKNPFGLNLRRVVGIHQGRERGDVLLVVLLPAFLMLVSAGTNAYAFTRGHLDFRGEHLINTVDALLRGLFLEALVFAFFRFAKVLVLRGKTAGALYYVLAVVPALVGLVAVVVSAGCGLYWVSQEGAMQEMVRVVASYLPGWLGGVFQSGVGLLFPVSLAVFAVCSVTPLIKEHVAQGAELSELAVHVENAEYHQGMMRAAQKEENEKIREQYRAIAEANAQRAVQSAKTGDLTFGLTEVVQRQQQRAVPKQAGRSSVVPVTVTPEPRAQLGPGSSVASRSLPQRSRSSQASHAPQLPSSPTSPMSLTQFPTQQLQPPVTGSLPAQVGPAPAWSSGNTQDIPIPMPAAPTSGGALGNAENESEGQGENGKRINWNPFARR